MGFLNWRQVGKDRDGWRRATMEALILLGWWNHRRKKEGKKERIARVIGK
jgi:hypothetical protein